MGDVENGGFAGFVMTKQVEGGRAGVTIAVEVGGVRARLRDGREFTIAYSEADFERGGASGRMIFVRSRSGDAIVGSEASGFEDAIASILDGLTRARFDAATHRQVERRRGRRLVGLKWFAVVVVAAVAIYHILSYGLQSATDNVPRSVDVQIGDAFEGSIEAQYPTRDVPVLDDAFLVIFERFKPHIDHEGFEFEFRFVDSSLVNAMALPGGRILVFRGLIEILEDENELAAVIAHEIAHVTQRHHLTGIARSIGMFAFVQTVFGDYSGLIVVGVEVMRFLAESGYSREQETEADLVGVSTLRAAKLDPMALERALRRMQDKVGSIPKSMKWVSTHPVDAERRAAITAAAEAQPNPAVEKLPIDWGAVRAAIGVVEKSEDKK